MNRPLEILRLQRAGKLTADLRQLEGKWAEVEVQFFWDRSEAESAITWSCPAFYYRMSPEERWQIAGVDIIQARGLYRKELQKRRPKPKKPSPAEVAGVMLEIGKFAMSVFTSVISSAPKNE